MSTIETKNKDIDKIIDELKNIIAKNFNINLCSFDGKTSLFEGGLWLNSVQMIILTIHIEKYYGKEFDSHLLISKNFENLYDLANIIMENF